MPQPAPASLTVLAERVQRRLTEVLAIEQRRWAEFEADLAEPVAEVSRLVLGGGKRLRPAFAHWGWVAAGGDPDDPQIVDVGAAFELMHAFALFHDDVMDDARTRRGQLTTHTVFAEHHRRAGWSGEDRRFGEGVAILVGDLAFVFADRLMLDANPSAWAVWNELRIELNIGQFLDILGSVRRERSIDYCERICRYKSGKYTIERPLHLGALAADARRGAELVRPFSAYGLPLGDAFQMRDDVMGAFGDPQHTGKPVGGDLREGKPTPLLARATAAADEAQLAVLDRVGAPDLTDAEVGAIQQVMVDTGALADLERTIERLTDQALAALDTASRDAGVTEPVVGELTALARYVSQRSM